GLEHLLKRLESGEIHFVCRDLTAPSPLAAEVLSARPYAYLDDAPLEERRTQAVMSRRWGDIDSTDDFGRLDEDAIAAVREEAWPEARNADELHDALMTLGFLTDAEASGNLAWGLLLSELTQQRRVALLLPLPQARLLGGEGWGEGAATEHAAILQQSEGSPLTQPSPPSLAMGERACLWIPAERRPQFDLLYPEANYKPDIVAPSDYAAIGWTRETALVDIARGRLTGLGPTTAPRLAASLGLPQSEIDAALLALESEGYVMRGRFSAASYGADVPEEWCER